MALGNNVVSFPLTTPEDDPGGLAGPSTGEAGGIGSAVVSITLGDGNQMERYPSGAVNIYAPNIISRRNYDDDQFGENLAARLPETALAGIANEVIEGVEADQQTRAELISQYQDGIDLLGTKLEAISTPSTASRSVSRVGHPLLLETMIRYHASAEAELLPAAGPAKVMTVGTVTAEEEQLAQDFESDFNYFLTEIAKEFYKDTSSMLMHQAYCGNAYKKIYYCPMRERPVSESVSMLDLIVSESATDLDTALRVTHQFEMSRTQLRRMQIAGHYRDLDLGLSQAQPDPGRTAIRQNEGLSPTSQRPQDIPYKFWETDIDLDLTDHPIPGKWEDRAPWGMPLAYKVTVEQQTRQVLGLWRNWKADDRFYRKQNMYVHYGMVPSLGFHHWGFLQILGNHTRALRAIWRLLIDAGMFSLFPGGIIIKNARKGTNEIAPNPGEWVDLDVPIGTDLRTVLMPLPYKTIDAVFMQFAQAIEQGALRLGGNVMIETGEGRTNVPVGTIMSQIEQNTQIMSGVHKRSHVAQKEELIKLREVFADNPEDLWRLARNPRRRWAVAQEFMDLDLVPASDPNIPSQVARIMQAWALMQVAQGNPQLVDMHEVLNRVFRTIRITSPEAILVQPGANAAPVAPPPDPRLIAAQQRAQQEQQRSEQRMSEQAQKSQEADRDHAMKIAEAQQDAVSGERDRQQQAQQAALESADRASDRASRERVAQLREETERLKTLRPEQESGGVFGTDMAS